MRKLGGAAVVAVAFVLLAGCSAPAPAPTVTVTAEAAPAPTVTVTVTAPPVPTKTGATADLTTDAGICVADADMTNLELNDALAPILGYPSDRSARTTEQDQAIRDYKNAAMMRMCPSRAG